VETARGPLLHLAALDAAGRISRYRVVPPTLWHAHPEGLLRVSLGVLAAASAAEWQQQISLIDPCVAYSVSKETEYA
jgi:Ni,Fe-hydrogenase I large subunit